MKLGLYNFTKFFKKKSFIFESKTATENPLLTKDKYPTIVSKLFSANKKINLFLAGIFFDQNRVSLSN